MDYQVISGAIAAAAAFLTEPVRDTATRALIDTYERLKQIIRTKANPSSDIADALEKLESKPKSAARKEVLAEELEELQLADDPDFRRAVEHLMASVPSNDVFRQQHVDLKQIGNNNTAQIAGGDIITTKQIKKVTKFTPGEEHVTSQQAKAIKDLVDKLAEKLPTEAGKPNYRAAYGILYAEYQVSSYREIPRESYEDAVSFLRQRGAMNRGKLRRSNPKKYEGSLFSAIWAKQGSLGWQKGDVYEFAFVKLSLRRRIDSLKKLGPNQLKKLDTFLNREIQKKRKLK